MQHRRLTHIRSSLLLAIIPLILSLTYWMSSQAMAEDVPRSHNVFQPSRSQPQPASSVSDLPLHFLDSAGEPLREQEVWLFCFNDSEAQMLLSQQWVQTDSNGSISALPGPCPWVAAVTKKHVQPSGKVDHGPAYWVFSASWPTGAGVAPAAGSCAMLLCKAGESIQIRDDWPLILFNVVASAEWEPEPGSSFIAELKQGLRSASTYLADLTDGYMAFGPTTLYTGGQGWEGADLRFQTANDLRPAAFVGGIVPSQMVYAPGTGHALNFRPASIFFGRNWNRNGAATGQWNERDGYRTIVHEWAHYALFLFDEYQKGRGEPISCTRPDLKDLPDLPERTDVSYDSAASAMDWHYTASEFWQGAISSAPADCAMTDQAGAHGESDWDTLTKWHMIQGLPGPMLRPAPDGPESALDDTEKRLLDHLYSLNPAERFWLFLPLTGKAKPPLLSPSTVSLSVMADETLPITPSQVAQVYLLRPGVTGLSRLVYQGTTRSASGIGGDAGRIALLDVRTGDSLRVFIDRYAPGTVGVSEPGRRYVAAATGDYAHLPDNSIVARANEFHSSLNLVYGMRQFPSSSDTDPGKITRMKVELRVPASTILQNPMAQVCTVDPAIGCHHEWISAMHPEGDGLWTASFEVLPGMEELPLFNVVVVSADNPGFEGLVRWFRDAGGVGPGHTPAGAPVGSPETEGMATVNLVDPSTTPLGPCNRVMMMPAADYAALSGSSIIAHRIIGVPLDLDIMIGDLHEVVGGFDCVNLSDRSIRLTLYYNEDDVARLGAEESQLQILHFDGGKWGPVNVTGVDTVMNWVAATVSVDGIYAIGVIDQ